ncbi:MAG: insulinase family protein [Hyphomicrobiales bacterium]|nr:insulinase family protein [Hyphomicrobiales bacterium]
MSVQSTTLASGLRIVTDRNESAGTAALNVHVAVGSRNETLAEHGLSHLIEHMAFKGTRRRSALQIAEEIESAGGDLNAATATEHTAYQARVLPEDVAPALDILADILVDSVFDAEELEREKDVILQEIAAVEDTPDDLVFEYFDAAAFPDQPIGRPILGRPESVKRIDRAGIRAYLDRFYGANTLIVSAAGAVRHDEVVAAAERLFAGLPQAAAPKPTQARYAGGEKRSRKKAEQANIVIGFESLSHTDPDTYAAHVFSNAVGGGMASRLFQEVREKRGLAYSIYTFNWSFADTGLFGLSAAASPRDAEDLMKVALDCVAAALDDLDETEVRRARAQMKVSLLTALESSPARAEQIARQTEVFGGVLARDEIVRRIDRLDVRAVRAAGRRLLSSAPSLAVVGPASRSLSVDRVAERLRTG